MEVPVFSLICVGVLFSFQILVTEASMFETNDAIIVKGKNTESYNNLSTVYLAVNKPLGVNWFLSFCSFFFLFSRSG